ncbi:MAG TPA: ABC transporter permease [bacterium]|nr:ABC transporter permease [bacterium]
MSTPAVTLPAPAHSARPTWRRFLRRRAAVVSLAFASSMILAALFAPVIAPYDPGSNDFEAVLAPPLSQGHVLGTDELGRDVLSRIVWGARASMQAGVLSTLLGLIVAVPIGLTAGYYRGWWESVAMRLADTLLAFPFLIIAVGLAAILGPSLVNATLAIGIVQVPKIVRVTRAEALSIREESYVEAAIAAGASDWSILIRHALPNMTSTLIVQATVILPIAIIAESSLSFLGLGVQPPTPSWGVMLTAAQSYMTQMPWLAILPGLAILVATLSFNLVGDGVRDAFDPKGLR